MLFIVTIEYIKPIEQIEKATEEHRAFLAKLKAAGKLLASGPFQPRTGGALILKTDTPIQAEMMLRGDPFNVKGLAKYDIRQWKPTLGEELFK